MTLKRYLDDGSGGHDKDRLRALIVGMATQNLVHIIWRIENQQMDKRTIAEIKTFVENIKNALNIKENLGFDNPPSPLTYSHIITSSHIPTY